MRIPAGHAISGIASVVENEDEELSSDESEQKELDI